MKKNELHFTRGFLPNTDPLTQLPAPFTTWENTAKSLPKLLVGDQLHQRLNDLEPFPLHLLCNQAEIERAMQIVSYLGHAYIWGNYRKDVPQILPAILAKPWFEIATQLGRPPVLSYASYALNNWQLFDPNKPIELGNIALIQNFLGGIDEEWFILIHVDIEAKAIPAINACVAAIQAVTEKNVDHLFTALQTIAHALEVMNHSLKRMPEHCDPYIYYHRVRPYIHGWKNHPALPHGLIYEGVADYQGQPQQFRGETGAQSSIIPTLDALLGITHANDTLGQYLLEMRDYMPPQHRSFMEYIETHGQIRDFVIQHQQTATKLRDTYNQCIHLIEQFRQTHLGYAASYIQKQHQLSEGNPNAVGTGGTPFMEYLKKHEDETKKFILPP